MKNPWVWIWGKQGHLQLNPNMNECTGMESQTPLEFWYSQAESLNDFPLPGSKFLTLEDVSKLQCRFSCPFYTCVGMVIEVSFIIRFHWVDFLSKSPSHRPFPGWPWALQKKMTEQAAYTVSKLPSPCLLRYPLYSLSIWLVLFLRINICSIGDHFIHKCKLMVVNAFIFLRNNLLLKSFHSIVIDVGIQNFFP